MRRAIERGLVVADLDRMTIGMLIDYLIEAQNEDVEAAEKKTKKEPPARKATQADIDAF